MSLFQKVTFLSLIILISACNKTQRVCDANGICYNAYQNQTQQAVQPYYQQGQNYQQKIDYNTNPQQTYFSQKVQNSKTVDVNSVEEIWDYNKVDNARETYLKHSFSIDKRRHTGEVNHIRVRWVSDNDNSFSMSKGQMIKDVADNYMKKTCGKGNPLLLDTRGSYFLKKTTSFKTADVIQDPSEVQEYDFRCIF